MTGISVFFACEFEDSARGLRGRVEFQLVQGPSYSPEISSIPIPEGIMDVAPLNAGNIFCFLHFNSPAAQPGNHSHS